MVLSKSEHTGLINNSNVATNSLGTSQDVNISLCKYCNNGIATKPPELCYFKLAQSTSTTITITLILTQSAFSG